MASTQGLPWLRSAAETEHAVAEWLRSLGHTGVAVTSLTGDGGIDVETDQAAAQVKAGMSPTGRPALQALLGAAAVDGRKPLFFSAAGYTIQATEWAEDARLALFTFDRYGEVEPAYQRWRKQSGFQLSTTCLQPMSVASRISS